MNIIKRIIQNVFRYRLTACFFIIGQLIMYVTIFGALGIYKYIPEGSGQAWLHCIRTV